jgi:3-hydroxyisobutyrate dehydrogenase-like beta-hydroxyacid dehydrogenase
MTNGTVEGSSVGIVGVGAMGSALAGSLLGAGADVIGFDVREERRDLLVELGGTVVDSPRKVLDAAPVVILSLPSAQALRTVVEGTDGLIESERSEAVCIETSTLAIDDKEWARQKLESHDYVLLDSPISGTGGQALRRDIIFYASGPAEVVERCLPVLEAMGRGAPYVGEFGAGSTMKFVSNLLVSVHTLAAAEALTLASRSGVDKAAAFELLIAGAGNSRMLEVRGPMMVEGDYPGDSATVMTLGKDVDLISEFAASRSVPTPLLSVARLFLIAAQAQGLGAQDPAVVAEVMSALAGGGGEAGDTS